MEGACGACEEQSSQNCGIIHRLKGSLPAHSLKLLYTTLLLPYLNYWTVVWAGGYQNMLKPIYILQKRAIRVISGAHYLAESCHLFKPLDILTIYDIYKLQLAMLIYRHHNGTLPALFNSYYTVITDVHAYNPRHRQNYRT